MNAVDIIAKKRDGEELTKKEIAFFIRGFSQGDIPDYQASAWAMAVLLQGMSDRETADLTEAMIDSGDRIDLSGAVEFAVDKHSTGGVGDKTTLVVEPVVSACGVRVGKMSGRGLSFTGGTLDKMESIPGFRSDLSMEEFIHQLKEVGLVLSGQTADLAPADGMLYALRDVTGTVPSIPLIASSVMSKKLAGGAQAIVLDVKVGLGAFMRTVNDATELARLMVSIGERAGRKMVALITDMNQPLGQAVGNALEVKEAIATLRGEGPADFSEHCMNVAGHMLWLAGAADSPEEGKDLSAGSIGTGEAFSRFKALVQAQGGDISTVDKPDLLPSAPIQSDAEAQRDGYVSRIHPREVGLTVVGLGGGRLKKGEAIDHSVGVIVLRKVGDEVRRGEPLFTVHARDTAAADSARKRLNAAVTVEEGPVRRLPLLHETLYSESLESSL